MDLVEKIEAARFLGREFLLWLWFECEVFEGTVSVPNLGTIGITFEKQVVVAQEPEFCTLKAADPIQQAEAHEALRRGKMPVRANLRILQGEREFAFRLVADSRGLSGVSIPNVVKEDAEQQFYDRMYTVEELEGMIDGLYGMFLSLRLSAVWSSTVAPAMCEWIRGGTVPVAAYRTARQKTVVLTTGPKQSQPEKAKAAR